MTNFSQNPHLPTVFKNTTVSSLRCFASVRRSAHDNLVGDGAMGYGNRSEEGFGVFLGSSSEELLINAINFLMLCRNDGGLNTNLSYFKNFLAASSKYIFCHSITSDKVA